MSNNNTGIAIVEHLLYESITDRLRGEGDFFHKLPEIDKAIDFTVDGKSLRFVPNQVNEFRHNTGDEHFYEDYSEEDLTGMPDRSQSNTTWTQTFSGEVTVEGQGLFGVFVYEDEKGFGEGWGLIDVRIYVSSEEAREESPYDL